MNGGSAAFGGSFQRGCCGSRPNYHWKIRHNLACANFPLNLPRNQYTMCTLCVCLRQRVPARPSPVTSAQVLGAATWLTAKRAADRARAAPSKTGDLFWAALVCELLKDCSDVSSCCSFGLGV